MNLTLKRVAPLQAGKMLAALYGLMSLLIIPFMVVAMAAGGFAARSAGGAAGPALPMMFGMGVGFMLLLPILYAAMGFVAGVISAFLYNLLARWIGGFELEFAPAAGAQPPTINPI